MSECEALLLNNTRVLKKGEHTPGVQVARQRGISPEDPLVSCIQGNRMWLPPKMVNPSNDDLVLEEIDILKLSNWADGTADTDWMLPVFWGLARGFQNVKIGEIGMRFGMSTLAFTLAARDTGGHVWSMDIDECIEGRRNIYHAGLEEWHTFLNGDSACLEFPEPLDILFIDGDHSYSGVSLDFENHRGSVKDGGIVLFHDPSSCPSVGSFCREVGAIILPMGAGLGVLPC